MEKFTEEAIAYHLLATATHGGYRELARIRRTAENWTDACAKARRWGMPIPDTEPASEALHRMGITIVMRECAAYPEGLRHIPAAPFALYLRGDLAALQGHVPALAIVGTRRPTGEGRNAAGRFAEAMADAGIRVASGLAFGIDRAAHEGCLARQGVTIAVLAGGVNAIYPRSHESLGRRILEEGGAIISEYPPGEPPFGYRFMERNRIVSGLARGVLVVEAPSRSGALITARYAAEQDRDLFVVPGPAASLHYRGSHTLIRQGAELVVSPEDILAAWDLPAPPRAAAGNAGYTAEEAPIMRALETSGVPLQVDKLSAMTRLEPRIVNRALTFLLIRGIVKEAEDGYTI